MVPQIDLTDAIARRCEYSSDVRTAVLRISGSDFVPHEWLDQHGIIADAVWQAGEQRGGRVPIESGLNLRIAEGEEIPSQVCGWVEARSSAIRNARALGASVVIDVGVTVGSADQLTASV